MANGPEDHPDMSCEQERFRSFSHGWRGDSSPCLLASAGYYYTKSGDLVKCFSCGGTVNNWNHRMDPYEVHRQMFPNCALVNNTEHRHQPWIPSTQATLLVEQAFRDPLISVASTPNLMGITTPVVRSPQMLNALLTHQAQVRVEAVFPMWPHQNLWNGSLKRVWIVYICTFRWYADTGLCWLTGCSQSDPEFWHLWVIALAQL